MCLALSIHRSYSIGFKVWIDKGSLLVGERVQNQQRKLLQAGSAPSVLDFQQMLTSFGAADKAFRRIFHR